MSFGDANGNLLVVYHDIINDFTVLDRMCSISDNIKLTEAFLILIRQ